MTTLRLVFIYNLFQSRLQAGQFPGCWNRIFLC